MPDLRDINKILQQHFDKVLIVTVPRFKERQVKVKQRLEGISFDFFYGADKQDFTEDFIKANYHHSKKNSLAPGYYFPSLNEGEIACSLSHRMVYQAMIDNSWQHVLILEDDVVPDHQQLAVLDECLNELPAEWELFYLGYLKNNKPGIGKKLQQLWYSVMAMFGMSKISMKMTRNLLPRSYSTHLWKAGFHDCTHAYAVSLSGAKKLLAAQTPVAHRADNLLSSLVLKDELKAFAVKEYIFNQEVFTDNTDKSTIREKWANQ